MSGVPPVRSTMRRNPAAGGCDNGMSVAIECEQTRPDDKGCDNEEVW